MCVYLLKAHTWLLIGKSDGQDVQLSTVRNKNTHSCLVVSLAVLSLPKSTPDGEAVMHNPLWWRSHCWGFLLSHCCVHGFTLSISYPTTLMFADLPVCPHLQPSIPHKERSWMLEKCSLFCPPNMQSTARLKGKLQSFGGNIAAVCFMWLLLFCCPILLSRSFVTLDTGSKLNHITMG